MPFTHTTRDGRTYEWTGHNICVCVKCDEIFNSVAAFDAHIRGEGANRKHDHSHLPRNARGYKVISLRADDATWPT